MTANAYFFPDCRAVVNLIEDRFRVSLSCRVSISWSNSVVEISLEHLEIAISGV